MPTKMTRSVAILLDLEIEVAPYERWDEVVTMKHVADALRTVLCSQAPFITRRGRWRTADLSVYATIDDLHQHEANNEEPAFDQRTGRQK